VATSSSVRRSHTCAGSESVSAKLSVVIGTYG
jgi:hypothetical protein